MSNTRTTLSIFCEMYGKQGGTIHAALNEFRLWDRHTQDEFCNRLMREMDAKTLQDMHLARDFFRARIGGLLS